MERGMGIFSQMLELEMQTLATSDITKSILYSFAGNLNSVSNISTTYLDISDYF